MVITFSTTKHDSVWKVNLKQMTIEQAQKDLNTTRDDIKELKYLFENFGYDPKFMGPNGVSFDLKDPTWLECMSVEKAVR